MSYRRKKGSGSRDLGLSSNGKGSANRVSDVKAFQENYDAIDWGRSKKSDDESSPVAVGLPPEGYRAFEEGEQTRPGDLFYSTTLKGWFGVTVFGVRRSQMNCFARKVGIPNPPTGYRCLTDGEAIQKGDLFYSEVAGDWVESCVDGELTACAGRYARKS